MKFLIHSSLTLLALAALNSCSSRLSEAELAAISSVSVPKATLAPASYKHPSVFEYREHGRSPHDGVGLMGALIGMTAAAPVFASSTPGPISENPAS